MQTYHHDMACARASCRVILIENRLETSKTRPTPYCRVLPPGECNGTIAENHCPSIVKVSRRQCNHFAVILIANIVSNKVTIRGTIHRQLVHHIAPHQLRSCLQGRIQEFTKGEAVTAVDESPPQAEKFFSPPDYCM